jgi:hypothetical protein
LTLLDTIDRTGTAAVGAEPVVRSILIAGRCVRFEFGTEVMADCLTRAFSHLPSCPDVEPALTVVAWDSAGTGSPPPPLPPDPDPGGPMWRRVLVDEPPLHAVAKPGPGTLSVVDRTAARAWYWCADVADVPIWEQGTPFLHVLHHWLSSSGMQLVHAGAAGVTGGGVLFVGKSGSGKSTSTLACLEAGMQYAGDDYVVVASEPVPTVHALYSSGKLDPGQMARFPELASWVVNPEVDDEKHVFFVADHAPDRVATSFPLRSVLLPRVTGEPITGLRPASPAAALAALAPSTIFQMPGAAADELAAIAALLRAVPARVLDAGTDLACLASVVRDLVTVGVR